MIEELTKYIKGIQEQFPLHEFINEPVRGLHIMFEVKNGEVQLYKKELYFPKKGGENDFSEFLRNECMSRELHLDFIDSWKAIRGKRGSRIKSVVPFALKFAKPDLSEDWKKWMPKKIDVEIKNQIKHIEEVEKKIFKLNGEEKIIEQVAILKEKLKLISTHLSEYIRQYFDGANIACDVDTIPETTSINLDVFQKYSYENLPIKLVDFAEDIIKLGKKDFIIIYLKNAQIEHYDFAYNNYLKEYVLNTTATPKVNVGDSIFGLSNYKNVASSNKPYLQHLTSPFDVNNRIEINKALLLNTFDRYVRARAFKTNPLPIFIDQSELNNEVINIIKIEGNDVSFQKIIRSLFDKKKRDLGNYYLLYISRGELKDMDFVSSFSFKLDIQIKQIVPYQKSEKDIKIDNVFQLEDRLLQPIFNNQLIKQKDDKITYRYFDDIDNNPKFNITSTTWNLIMKYRKSFYDFIYKSRRQSVTNHIIHDILRQGILDDIRHDEFKNEKHTKQYDIYTKLNIWFSLWDFFKNSNNKNDLNMANKILELQERLRLIRESKENEHLQNDEEFAFTVGQIIYFLLDKSKSGNKSHALLEPFIQKTNTKELKKAITNTFNAYKHEIDFGKGRFEKLCSEVLSYEVENNLKELTPLILAGYFSNSVIYEKSNN